MVTVEKLYALSLLDSFRPSSTPNYPQDTRQVNLSPQLLLLSNGRRQSLVNNEFSIPWTVLDTQLIKRVHLFANGEKDK